VAQVSVAEAVLEHVAGTGLLAPARPVVVMLSGGRDSTCLLDVAVAIVGRAHVRAVHLNYGLRPGADGDERHCQALCDALGVPLHVSRAADLRPRRGNLQAWARDLRYEVAAALAAAHAADVAAGHTATDQVETILYRLASAPSRRALLGMRARDGSLIRPLLAVSREQTGAYCAERGLGFRDDESNASGAYARGRVRHRLVPILREIHPAAEANVLLLAERLRDEAEVLDSLVARELGGRQQIELSRLRALPDAIARLVVTQLADSVHGRPVPGPSSRLGDILKMRDAVTTHIDLPGGVRATAVNGLLSFSLTPGRAARGDA
jgi:tRNA(Ile)-lysidine synthase